jgi:hypothetical protein
VTADQAPEPAQPASGGCANSRLPPPVATNAFTASPQLEQTLSIATPLPMGAAIAFGVLNVVLRRAGRGGAMMSFHATRRPFR